MFKSLLRNTSIYALSLFLLPFIVAGVEIQGGVQTLVIGGIALTLLFLLVKPVFSVLTYPFNLITMGLFSIVTNAVILYLLTIFVPNVNIHAFKFAGASIAGFVIPAVSYNTFFSFLIASVVLSALSGAMRWLIK